MWKDFPSAGTRKFDPHIIVSMLVCFYWATLYKKNLANEVMVLLNSATLPEREREINSIIINVGIDWIEKLTSTILL